MTTPVTESFTKTVTTRFGHRLEVIEKDAIGREVLAKGAYEPHILAFIKRLLGRTKPRVSLDIGANVGNHAVVIAECSDRLLAFEPNPAVHALLAKNLQANELAHAQAFSVAMGETADTLTLHVRLDGNVGASSLTPQNIANTKAVDVDVVVGDDFLREKAAQTVDFMKIDVEGFEFHVMQGLRQTIDEYAPLILMEWNSATVKKQFAEAALLKTLFKSYRLFAVKKIKDKDLYVGSMPGLIRRLFRKYYYGQEQWCLAPFEYELNYECILLVPSRFEKLLNECQQLSSPRGDLYFLKN